MVGEESRIEQLEKLLAQRDAELTQRAEQLAVINSVQQALVNQMDMQAIYDLVGDHIRNTFDSQAVIIATFDHDSGEEHFGYAIEKGERFQLKPRPFDKLRQSLIDTKQKILINENFEEAYRQFGMRVLPGSEFPKSALYVPLMIGEKVTGYVSLQNVDKENAFSESDVRLLETLANSMSTALENARLLKETEQRTTELAVINGVQEALAKEMDIQAIYDLVGNRIRELFDAQVVGIATFNHKDETEHIHYLIEKGERYYPVPRPLNILRKHLIATREKVLINKNFDEVAATFGMKSVPGTQPPKSAVYVPLMVGEKVTGNISLQNIDRENAISDSDVRLLETLANSMSVALENARLFDETTRLLKETEQQKAELGVINSVQEGLAKELNMQAIYDLVGDRIRELFNAQAVMIVTFDHETATEHFKYLIEDGQRFYLPPRPYDKLRQHLIVTRQKIVINTNYAEAYARFGLKTLPGTNPTKSGVFVPLIIGDKVNSYISLQNMETENAFSESDIRLLETLANSMSVALENARLFDETTRLLKETEQRTAELAVINSVQEGLARELDMKAIYELVGNKIREVFDAQVVIIATFDHETGTEKFNYMIEKGEQFHPEPRRYDKLRYQLIISKQKILINNNAEGALTEFGLKVIQGSEMPKSLLYVPLIVGNKVTSYVSLQNLDKENAFSDSDVRLLETLANSMSVALENARLFDETNRLLKETEQRTSELAVINSVQEGLVAQMDLQSIYDLVGEKIRNIFNAQVVDIVTYDKLKNQIEDRYAYEKGDRTLLGAREPNGFRKHVIKSKQVLLINNEMEKAMKEYDNDVLIGDIPKANLFVPLILRGEVNGIISLQNTDKENVFSDSDVSLLTTLANSMSVALESASLFHETNRLLKETEQRTAELAVINSVQEGLAKELNIQGIYELIGEKMREIFNAQVFDIVTYDKKTQLIEDRYTYEKGDRTLLGPRPLKGFRKNVFETAKPLVINRDLDAQRAKYDQTVMVGKGAKSIVLVPLITSSEVSGVISLQNLDQENAFSDSDVNLLTTLANSMTVALANARLFDETNRLLKETEQRTAELAVINSVQEGLAKELDMNAIYTMVGDRIRNLFDAQVVAIATFNHEEQTEKFQYMVEKGERFYAEPRPLGKLRLHLIKSRKKIVINKQEEGYAWFGTEVIPGTEPIKSAVFVPLMIGDKITSYVTLQNIDRENAFTEAHIRLLETLANTMSVALENARLFDETNRLLKETEQRTSELAVINSVQEGLVAQMDMNSIYELVGEKIRKIFKAQVVDIVTYDKTKNLIEDKYSYEKGDRTLVKAREPIGFRKHVIETGELLLHNHDVEQAMRDFGNKILIGQMPKSQIYVPMIAAGEVTGVISLQNLDHENAFSNSDVSLITTLANSMSVALENARLFDETNRLLKETEQRTAELAVINSVQDGLAKELDMRGIYHLVGDRVQNLFNAQTVIIASFDLENKIETFNYFFENGSKVQPDPRPINKLRQILIDKKQRLYISTEDEARKVYGVTAIGNTKMPKSLLFVPLLSGNIMRGYVSLQNLDTDHAFSESDIRLLETLSNSMSVALENARLFDETNRLLKETEQRTAELAVINSVQDGLAKELDMQGIYNLVGDRVQILFKAQAVIIATFDLDNKTEHFNYIFENGEKVSAEPRTINKLRRVLIDKKSSIYIPSQEQARKEFEITVVTGTQMPKSLLFVPLLTGNIIKGYVSLQNLDFEHAFTKTDIRLLETLANSMSVALENARLFDETNRLLKETEQRTAELAVINSVQEGLARELDIQGIYNLIGDRLCELFPDTEALVIRTFDYDSGLEHFRYAIEKDERLKIDPRPFIWASQHLIRDRKAILINENYLETSKKYGGTGVTKGEPPKSAVFVPMVVGDVVKGSISLQNVDRENAFTESDLRLLTTLTNSMSVALENARLFDETNRLLKETEQRTAELGIINSVQEGLASKLDIQAVYDLVGDKIRDVFDTQGISISYYDREKNYITNPYYLFKGKRIYDQGFELGKGLTSHIIQTGLPLLINENAIERYKELGAVFAPSETEDAAKSWLGIPLITGGQVNGTIRLENYERENAYSESDVSLLQTLANSMSVALENARLFDETNRLLKETEQRTAELAVINSVQEGLAKELDIQGIYELVGDRLCSLFPDTQTLVIRTFDHESGIEHWRYAKEKSVRQNVEPRPFNWNSKELILTKKPLDIKENYVEVSKKHGGSGVTAGQPPKSAVFVPMMVGDMVKGSVSLQNVDKENAFTDADLRLLTTITNSMSVALENARLFEETNRLLKETEQRTGELAVINSVQEDLVREINIQAIYDLVGDRICKLFDTQTLIIRTFDHQTGMEQFHYAIEKGVHLERPRQPIIWANKLLIQTVQPLLINKNYAETAHKHGGTGVGKGLPPKSAMFVPMIVGDVVKGSVSLQNVDRENAFSESDLRLLTTLTNSMSVALENARLFDETTHLLADAKQRASELSTVNSISKALASQLDPDDLIKLVGDKLKDLFRANIVYLALLNQKTKTIHFPYQFGDDNQPMKLGEGLTSKIILTGEPLLINKDVTNEYSKLGLQRQGTPAASYLGVPIPVGDDIIGVLSVQSTENENSFNENDLRLLSTIAASVGVALRNATLFEDVKLAKMEAEEATKAAEKANEAKSAFLSTVSHELRTPLTSVLGFAKIIRKRLDEKIFPAVDRSDAKTGKTINQISENLEVVISEGERLTHLINDVLDLAKIEAGKMEWSLENVSMTEVAERAIAATSSLFEQKTLKLIKQIDTDLPDISGDRDKLIQVIINLISNSVKFTDKGSVTCKVFKEKDEIVVSISDTGIGIAPEDFAAVFEQFKQVGGDTLTDKPKGTGLGLPICKEIVEHHGGRIWLESEIGKGSTFSFALPVSKTGSAKPVHLDDLVKQLKAQMANSKFKIVGKDATILVVDDDDSIRSLLQQELSDAGYLIEQATNGKEALEAVRKNKPDLIILDVMMPEMNGFDVAAVLKNDPQTMDIPIIVLSVVQDKARGYRIGVDRYLTKPINTTELFAEVGSLLEQGKSKKKVMVVDEDSAAVRSLTDVLQAKGYHVVESDGKELVKNAISAQPDIIILNSVLSDKQEIVQSLRFEKGLENVLFLIYQ